MNKIHLHFLEFIGNFIPNIIVILFGLVPFVVPVSYQTFMPDFMICVLYFWAVYVPDKVSLMTIFIIGLLQDIHLGVPLGTFTFASLLLFISSLSYHQYLVKKPFILSWLIFSFIVILTSLFKMSFNIFFLIRPSYHDKFIYEAIVTIFSYPAIASLCFNLHQKFR